MEIDHDPIEVLLRRMPAELEAVIREQSEEYHAHRYLMEQLHRDLILQKKITLRERLLEHYRLIVSLTEQLLDIQELHGE